MIEARKLKETFRARWNLPERVAGWVDSGLNLDFRDPASRAAWRTALENAAGRGGKNRSALDLGTGPGTLAEMWAELGYRTSGVDFSPGMLKAARAEARRKKLTIEYVEGDAEAPPFPRRKFNVISSRFVLFTLPHPGYAVRRWVGMLRPGGALVLVGHDKSSLRQRRRPPRHAPPSGKVNQRHQEALRHLPFMDHTPNDLQVVMEAAGLRDIRRVAMDEVVAKRAKLTFPGTGAHLSPPFIITGRK